MNKDRTFLHTCFRNDLFRNLQNTPSWGNMSSARKTISSWGNEKIRLLQSATKTNHLSNPTRTVKQQKMHHSRNISRNQLWARDLFVLDNVENQLQSRLYGWSITIIRCHGYMYITWDINQNIVTRTELYKIHRHFQHPSSDKVMALLKPSKLECVDSNTRTIFEKHSQSCSTCQTFAHKQPRFHVSLPNHKVVFNRAFALDFMWLDGYTTLHVVHVDTHFSSASILSVQTVEHIHEWFLECWTTSMIILRSLRGVRLYK